jgi:hypothetical protein
MLSCLGVAHADLTYVVASGATVERRYVKGAKLAVETGDVTTVFDCESKTVTVIDRARRTYTVRGFAAIDAGRPVLAQAKETGETRTLRGVKARRIEATAAAPGAEFETGLEAWIADDVEGSGEWRAFWARWANAFPWAALGPDGPVERAVWQSGIPVRETLSRKAVGAPPQSEAQKKQLEQAMAKLRQLASAGGAQGAAAQEGLRKLAASGVQEEVRESSAFSSASVADSVFTVPEKFTKGQ